MTDKQEKHRAKKKELIELSKLAKQIQEHDQEERNINSILIKDFYTDKKNIEFNTFNEWMKKGQRVKKGEKAFLVWGKKRKNNQNTETKEPQTKEEKEFSFYPICYIFSNAQVEPSNAKN